MGRRRLETDPIVTAGRWPRRTRTTASCVLDHGGDGVGFTLVTARRSTPADLGLVALANLNVGQLHVRGLSNAGLVVAHQPDLEIADPQFAGLVAVVGGVVARDDGSW